MHNSRRSRPLLTVLALIALLFAPWPAQATPIDLLDSFNRWLADFWDNSGFILDPDGMAGGEPVSTPTEGFILDPSGGASSTGGAMPPAGTDSVDEGFILDPNGRP